MKLPGLPEPAALEPASEPRVVDGELVARAPRGDRVTPVESAVITHLVDTQGRSVAEVAELLGRNPATVRANLKHGRDLLKVFVPEAIDLWISAARVQAEKGDHRAAKDLVYAAGAAAQPQHQAGPSMQVAIGIQLPGLPVPVARTDESPED